MDDSGVSGGDASGGGVVVSGATGFLGGAVARRLHREGRAVLALGRDPARLAALRAAGVPTSPGDLAGRGPPPAFRADAFVHCAALSSPWGAVAAFRAANVDGTATALRWARATGARRFVHVSTPSLYFAFRDQRDVREDDPLPPPVNAYAQTKREAEDLVRREAGLDAIILRPRGLYGAGDAALLPRLLRAARRGPLPRLRGGCAETDLTHVDDAVEAVLAALAAPRGAAVRTFNVSGGQPLRLATVIEAVCARAGVPVRWRSAPAALAIRSAALLEAVAARLPGRPEPPITAYGAGVLAYSQTLDISAAARRLGWRPRIGFDEGLARTFPALR